MRKLNAIEQDILSYLKSIEPKTVLWREIVNQLWPRYEHKYPKSGKHGFGVAISRHLTTLQALDMVKQIGNQYGTPNAKFQAVALSDLPKEKLKEQFLRALSSLINEHVRGNPFEVYRAIDDYRRLAPPEWRKLLDPTFKEVVQKLYFGKPILNPIEAWWRMKYKVVPTLLDVFSFVIYKS